MVDKSSKISYIHACACALWDTPFLKPQGYITYMGMQLMLGNWCINWNMFCVAAYTYKSV